MSDESIPRRAILFDERGLAPDSPYVKGQWRHIASHTEAEIRGFFGEYRFLSNFWPAHLVLDGAEYSCVENAYKAAKFAPEDRGYFLACSPYQAVAYERATQAGKVPSTIWASRKVDVMRALVTQKFCPSKNPALAASLRATGNRTLEETNWWNDTFWGVHRNGPDDPGTGQNMLGQILMAVRAAIPS